MLAVIAGLERISAGRVAVAGAEFAGLSEDALALFRRRHVGVRNRHTSMLVVYGKQRIFKGIIYHICVC